MWLFRGWIPSRLATWLKKIQCRTLTGYPCKNNLTLLMQFFNSMLWKMSGLMIVGIGEYSHLKPPENTRKHFVFGTLSNIIRWSVFLKIVNGFWLFRPITISGKALQRDDPQGSQYASGLLRTLIHEIITLVVTCLWVKIGINLPSSFYEFFKILKFQKMKEVNMPQISRSSTLWFLANQTL